MCLHCLSKEVKYLQHLLECEGRFFSLLSHTVTAFYAPSESSLSPTHIHLRMQKHKLIRILYAVKDFLRHPQIPTILTSQPLLQLHCRPQPGPVRNIRLALTRGFVCQAYCLGREYSHSGYPLCLTEPGLLCRGTQHFHST